ncbi:OmpA family protein [Sinirhodobacter populi]|uniref:OmpA family protein n=1 Tax=Paenirhodobacter populi TaxID=2306993 RepID=A0A443KKV2_9RHOB|nr:OmpA family protein [Sinirhodobacter populi]RWR33412.1 OmpA family protein [Sinirhodobacter populi]
MKKSIPFLVATAGLMVLSACADGTSYDTSVDPNARRNTGAVMGAMLGGVLGATSGGDERITKAAAGAIVGGLAGGAIGSALDNQARELSRDLTTSGATVVNTGSQLVVTMPQDVLFAVDSDVVRADLQRDLNTLAGSLNRYPNTTVQIVGHTDNTGAADYNQRLSQRRASSVAQVLIAAGVPSSRIVTVGRGEDQPIASNLTADGRAKNRRVEFVITPNR